MIMSTNDNVIKNRSMNRSTYFIGLSCFHPFCIISIPMSKLPTLFSSETLKNQNTTISSLNNIFTVTYDKQ